MSHGNDEALAICPVCKRPVPADALRVVGFEVLLEASELADGSAYGLSPELEVRSTLSRAQVACLACAE